MMSWFRILGLLEALSFLGLLLIAMPMKYIWDMPFAVRVVGSIHGGLFVVYILAALYIADKFKWPLKTLFYSWVGAVLPMGTIIFDRKFLSPK